MSYNFCNFVVRTKYISLPKDVATFEEISDIGEVYQDEPADSSFTVHDGEIAGGAVFHQLPYMPFMQEEGSIYHTILGTAAIVTHCSDLSSAKFK